MCSNARVSCLAYSSTNTCSLGEGGSLNSTFNWQLPEHKWIILPDLLLALKHEEECCTAALWRLAGLRGTQ